MGGTCSEDQKVGGGFIDSFSKDFKALQMIPYDDQFRNKNLQQHPQAAPRSNYAKQSNEKPKLFYLVQDSRRRQFDSRSLASPSTSGIALPVYYIKKFKAYYEGDWDAGLPSGLGKIYFANGAYFEGPFQKGTINGQDGIYIYPDGSFKRGHIINGKLEGYAKFVSRAGNFIYQGNWVNDQPNGKGVQIYPDGSRYQGQFVNGIKNDNNAVYKWPNGKTYVGPFKNGYMEGHGKLTMHGGKGQYVGEFSRNLKVGQGKMRTQTGVYQGPFQNGEIHGIGSFTWDDGKIYEGQFSNGELHGNGVMYYPNGQMVKGIWHRGQNLQMQKVDVGKSQLKSI